MSADQSVFRFELNESLFFEKGQEVAEMRGISLDPEISIQAYNEYISIKGSIELRGEYLQVDVDEKNNEEPLLDFEDLHAKRYIEKVVVGDNHIAEFMHRFPIEISVPTYRITDFNDVTVSVDAFDYEVPENSQLKLYSMIAIHGINHEVKPPQLEKGKRENTQVGERELEKEPEVEKSLVESGEIEPELEIEEEPKLEVRDKEPELEIDEESHLVVKEIESELEQNEIESEGVSREAEDTFQFEIKQKQEVETEEHSLFYQENAPILADSEETENEDGRVKIKSQSFADFFGKVQEAEEALEEDVEDAEVTDDDQVEIEEVLETAQDDNSEQDASTLIEDVSYLSDVFRNTEENQYIKMRLCIVQKDDTIDTIAERFQVSPLQLIKQNQLEDDFDVTAGQLLYIPAGKK